jgi:hypothetical protein
MKKNPQNNAMYQMILEEHSLDLDVETEFLRLYIGFEANPGQTPINFFVGDGDEAITHENGNLKSLMSVQKTVTKVTKTAPGHVKNPNAAIVKDRKKLAKDLAKQNLVRAPPKTTTKVVTTPSGKNILVQPIPMCAANYAMVLPDPWNGMEACLPCDLMPLPSQKNYAFCRTDMVIGTDGIGFALIKPVAAADLPCVDTTTATSAGTLTTALQSFTNTLQSYQSNNPFTTAAFMDGSVSARFTAYGISVQYDGKLMDRNGVVYCFEEPDNQSLESWTPNEIFSANFAKQYAVTEKKFTVCHSGPTDPSDLEFRSGTAGTLPRGADYTMGIIVSGVPGDKYIVNAVFRCEYIGNSVSGKTMTHPAGGVFGAVVAAAKDVVLRGGPLKPADAPSMWQTVKNFVSENAPFLANAGMAIGKGIAAIATRNPAIGMSALGDLGSAIMGNGGPSGNLRLTDTQRMVMQANAGMHGHTKPKKPEMKADPYFLYDNPYLYQYYHLFLVATVSDDDPVGKWVIPLINPAAVENVNRLSLYSKEGDPVWWRVWNQTVWNYAVEGLTLQSSTTPFAVAFHEFEINLSIKAELETMFQDWMDDFLGQTPPSKREPKSPEKEALKLKVADIEELPLPVAYRIAREEPNFGPFVAIHKGYKEYPSLEAKYGTNETGAVVIRDNYPEFIKLWEKYHK